MFTETIVKLMKEYGTDIQVAKAFHLHDEDEWNEYTITYKGVIVGSELVPYDTIRSCIENVRATKGA